MIQSISDLRDYLLEDALASRRSSVNAKLLGDEIWKYQIALRKCEYYSNVQFKGIGKYIALFPKFLYKYIRHTKGVQLGFSIPLNVFDKGLSIAHIGTIVVNDSAKVGKNCRIQEDVNIGATNGSSQAARIGSNVFIGTGAKIIGEITIADDVTIGANAVVVKSIKEPGTTWGGVPAHKISNHDSHSNLNPELFK